jgi:hypothetical protein
MTDMAEYLVEIEGKNDLPAMNLQILGEEAGAAEFIRSSIAAYNNQITNLAMFRELQPGTLPKALTLIKQGDAQSAGTRQVWAGVMVVAGANMAVIAYRAT